MLCILQQTGHIQQGQRGFSLTNCGGLLQSFPKVRAKEDVKAQARFQSRAQPQQLVQKNTNTPSPSTKRTPVEQSPSPMSTSGSAAAATVIDQAPVVSGPAQEATATIGTEMSTDLITLAAQLELVCQDRGAPSYPALSRRLNEQGVVVLRVILGADGVVADARVQNSSGFARLDNAALAAVRSWRCSAPQRHGQPVRATALQPFHFVLQGE